METITTYRDKKLVQYLKPGLRVCLSFRHGIGDTVMFQPIYETLKRLYPDVHWNLKTYNGQEVIWDDGTDTEYDYWFEIAFPSSEHLPGITKPQLCCDVEIGIKYSDVPEPLSPPPKRNFESPLVAVHFQSTCDPSINVPPSVAQRVWNGILKAGLIPIEVHFQHKWHNKINTKFPFITATVREADASMVSLIGLLERCRACIGVNSGPFYLAKSMGLPVLYLRTKYTMEQYLRNPGGLSLMKNQIREDIIEAWLRSLSSDAIVSDAS